MLLLPFLVFTTLTLLLVLPFCSVYRISVIVPFFRLLRVFPSAPPPPKSAGAGWPFYHFTAITGLPVFAFYHSPIRCPLPTSHFRILTRLPVLPFRHFAPQFASNCCIVCYHFTILTLSPVLSFYHFTEIASLPVLGNLPAYVIYHFTIFRYIAIKQPLISINGPFVDSLGR